MRLDRTDMRKILEVLHSYYPDRVGMDVLPEKVEINFNDVAINCLYLQEHGLVEVNSVRTMRTTIVESVQSVRITASGIDFILDDGGLSAILGVVTVKLHEDTVRALLLNGIEASPAPEGEKSALREAIGKAPATSFNAVINSLVGLAMSKGPEAVQLLSRHFLAAM